MKLKDNLFTVLSGPGRSSESGIRTSDVFEFDVRMNAECFIYKAHFPGEPVTPGVCILQMGLELLELALGTPLSLKTVKNIKFLQIIRPEETPFLKCVIRTGRMEDSGISANIVIGSGEETFAKLSIVCQKEI